jgi:type I restriction enzyme R subunit
LPSTGLRNKKDLIENFVNSVTTTDKIDDAWQVFIAQSKVRELDRIIAEEQLKPEPTHDFMSNAFRDGGIPTAGTAITRILPPVSLFSKDNSRAAKKQSVIDKLSAFFERYSGLG